MTDQELKKLRRTDLLELLLAQSKENTQLQDRIKEMEEQLASRRIVMDKAGSMAEAALQLNRVFEAADDAALQYLENIRKLSDQQEEICKKRDKESREEAERCVSQAHAEAERIERETKEKCDAMLASAERDSQEYWDKVKEKLDEYVAMHEGLREMLNAHGWKDM